VELERLKVEPGARVALARHDPGFTGAIEGKSDAKRFLRKSVEDLARHQDVLYAQDVYSVLLIFQALDAAGKDSTIKHVMSGVNPQGCQVFSFKAPSKEELDHDYLWRSVRALPERGRIGIHNRSYYEEVLVVRVHPEILVNERLPRAALDGIWARRFREINSFERYLVDNGTVILKFFLNVSKDEQRRRFLDRIRRPEKQWKFSMKDVQKRALWDKYMDAYEEMLTETSTAWAPWYIVPADHKWFTRIAVASIVCRTLDTLDLHYPKVTDAQRTLLKQARRQLEAEDA